MLLYFGIVQALEKPQAVSMIPEVTGAVAGVFLLAGLWTPVAGTVAFLMQVWVFNLTGVHEPLIAAISGTLCATIAMIGPGAWSIDARIFGRKHIETRLPQK